MNLPEDFSQFTSNLIKSVEKIEGYITEKEMRFIALVSACSTAKGEILEIGSFKGKSTIVIAKSALLSNNPKVVSVDPLTSPSVTDPDLKGEESCYEDFIRNIKDAGVEQYIEFHQKYSYELAKDWNRKIRFLWIDGDHTYKGVKLDFDMFYPYLSNGAIVAIHDVLHRSEGCLRIFMEDILLSSNFGPSGLCGSIGWSQYIEDEDICLRYRNQKIRLYEKLGRIIPYVSLKEYLKDIKGITKLKYQIIRALVPHREIKPSKWKEEVMFFD